ncbi:hypothetical protein IAT38_002998 [Cryptococcus sp. DSM 104549]
MPTSKSSIDHRDVYYRKGKSAGYRARSAYKLLHLDEEFDLFSGVTTAVDLCAAPGSWSQVLGQKLKPGKEGGKEGAKVVSVDLQPMAPLANITILQTDITLPSTIPLVLDSLGGRKADLVVCDGAPDVTGVHDLDAYLHSQLLLAALTLSLTLLAPHGTLIFKIFLSPLDPQAALLASQLRCFFPGPAAAGAGDAFGEFDVPGTEEETAAGLQKQAQEGTTGREGGGAESKEGYDLSGRRGGVWVRKPRSSRKGSGEAFVLCRNFDPAKVPLPETFSETALAELRKQTGGTLTLDSLSGLGLGEEKESREWEMVKGYVGGGDLNAMTAPKTRAPPISLQLPITPPTTISNPVSPTALFAHPTPLDGPPEYFSPHDTTPPDTTPLTSGPTYLSPSKIRLAGPAQRAAAMAHSASEGASTRQSSLDSLTANPSPVRLSDTTRPWVAASHTSPPSVTTSHLHGDPAINSLSVPSGARFRSISNASASSFLSVSDRDHAHIVGSTPLVSPALSSGSRTDLFFSSSPKDSLPVPPKPLPNAGTLGRGLPAGVLKSEDRSASLPLRPRFARDPELDASSAAATHARAQERTSSWANTGMVDLAGAGPSGWANIPEPRAGAGDLRFGFEEISTSRLRSMSNPAPPQGVNGVKTEGTGTGTGSSTPTPKAEYPSRIKHSRRESQQLEREHREAVADKSVRAGDVLAPESLDEGVVAGGERESKRGWRIVKKLGEGAFSAVWSAVPARSETNEGADGEVVALKLMDRHLSLLDSRTRISFLREVEVLRHISHPSIVAYVDSFSTSRHDVLVLERLGGGELFDLISDAENRRRMVLPGPKPENEGEGWDRDGEGFVRRVFTELNKAVGWLHEVGVVHRDIKLENILFATDPFALPPTSTSSIPLHLLPASPAPLIKLTDFGLSRFISPASPLLQTRCGSESFAAPEIIMGKPYDGRQTDAWAMGVVLYGLVVGELPFDREEGDAALGGASTPGGKAMTERDRGRKRMMRIAKGEFSWPASQPTLSPFFPDSSPYTPGTGTPGARQIVSRLLVRDPTKRARLSELWGEQWMQRVGAVPPPATKQGDGEKEGGRRKVLDGFLVEEDGIEEVARAEH